MYKLAYNGVMYTPSAYNSTEASEDMVVCARLNSIFHINRILQPRIDLNDHIQKTHWRWLQANFPPILCLHQHLDTMYF